MRERDIEDWAVAKARRNGWWVRKFRSQHRRSAPDDIFAKARSDGSKMSPFFIEFKATGEKPTPLQLKEHEDMAAAGLVVYVCDSRAFFDVIMDSESKIRGHVWR